MCFLGQVARCTYVGCVLDVLDAAVGQGDAVLAHDVSLGVSAAVLAEVGVVVVVMHPVLEAEGVGLLVVLLVVNHGGGVHDRGGDDGGGVDHGGGGDVARADGARGVRDADGPGAVADGADVSDVTPRGVEGGGVAAEDGAVHGVGGVTSTQLGPGLHPQQHRRHHTHTGQGRAGLQGRGGGYYRGCYDIFQLLPAGLTCMMVCCLSK